MKVTVSSPRDGSTAFDVRIRATAGPDLPPFGTIDAPPDPVTLGADPILFQGWALDDTSMKRVSIGHVDASGRFMSLGERCATAEDRMSRASFRTRPISTRRVVVQARTAAVRHLPRPLVLQFVAEDGSGHRAEIGRRTLR